MTSETQPPEADRIRIGDCTVTLSSREVDVVGARRPRRLTPKALGVLRVLLRQPGRVVTREELFAEVWPDTLPTNDVLTQAVTQLRKAFSTGQDNGQTYIETIAKTGYRLLVPVQVLADAVPEGAEDAASPEALAVDEPVAVLQPAANAAARRRWRYWRRRLLLALGVAMLLALLVLTVLLVRRPSPVSSPVDAAVEDGTRVIGSPERPYRLITATAGFEKPIPRCRRTVRRLPMKARTRTARAATRSRCRLRATRLHASCCRRRKAPMIVSRPGHRMAAKSPLHALLPTAAARCWWPVPPAARCARPRAAMAPNC